MISFTFIICTKAVNKSPITAIHYSIYSSLPVLCIWCCSSPGFSFGCRCSIFSNHFVITQSNRSQCLASTYLSFFADTPKAFLSTSCTQSVSITCLILVLLKMDLLGCFKIHDVFIVLHDHPDFQIMGSDGFFSDLPLKEFIVINFVTICPIIITIFMSFVN